MIWGISSYSLYQAMKEQRMTIEQVIAWAAEQGAQHIELVPRLGFELDEAGMVERIGRKAEEHGLSISNIAIDGNVVTDDDQAYEAEIQRILRYVDIAYQLGCSKLRHDLAWLPPAESSIDRFEANLDRMVDACRVIADHAAPLGITTSIENHGYYVQGSDRVLRLVHAVQRDNFKITMDIGNFLCVDEDPLAAVKKVLPYASMVHLKDFYVRPARRNLGPPFFQSTAGNYLRGAIIGHGDIALVEILQHIKASGYKGYASIEFEGIEDCQLATKLSLDQVRGIWEDL